jgi:hypothetical protein
VTADLLAQAQAGDGDAFARLIDLVDRRHELRAQASPAVTPAAIRGDTLMAPAN